MFEMMIVGLLLYSCNENVTTCVFRQGVNVSKIWL